MINGRKHKTILLVEDEALLAIEGKMNLENYGYEVITADTGEEAVSVCKTADMIDLILMDIDLGKGIDGTKAAEEILKNKDIQIVFQSSHTEPEIVEKTERITAYGYVVKYSGITVLDASIKMAFKLFEANRKNVESEERNRALLNAIPDMMFMFNRDGIFINYATNQHTLLAVPGEMIIGKGFNDILPADVAELSRSKLKSLFESGQPQLYEYQLDVMNEVRAFESRLVLCGESKALAIVRDITERKKIELALAESDQFNIQIIQSAQEGIIVYDKNLNYKVINPFMEKLMGLSASRVIGKHPSEFFPFLEDVGILENLKKVLCGETITSEDFPFQIPNTDVKGWASDTSAPLLNVKGEIIGVIGTIRDITKRKQAEEKIKSILEEKEIIIKEVHHLIKSNMNILSALFILQAKTLDEPNARMAIEDAGNRVKSIQLLYEKLYQSSNFQKISVRDYLPSLINEILENFPNKSIVQIEYKIEDFLLDTTKVQPLGILINELLTNIMKYAFVGREVGQIIFIVSLKPSPINNSNIVSVEIQDNGNGMPETINFENSPGFGLMLVSLLTKQLRGKITINRQNGTKIILEFEQ